MSFRKYIIITILLFSAAASNALAQDGGGGIIVGIDTTAIVSDIPQTASDQSFKNRTYNRWAITTNFVDYLNLGTVNLEIDCALGRSWTIGVESRYNAWSANKKNPEKQFQNRKLSMALVTRGYFWHVYTDWFVSAKIQYQMYNRTNFLQSKKKYGRYSEEGDAYGLGLGIGYDRMIHEHINLEFGASVWAGYKTYTRYDCAVCGVILDDGAKADGFLMLDNIYVSIQFIF